MTTKPPAGSLYLDRETGHVYRLRYYSIDWKADPFTGDEDQPEYAVHYTHGPSSMAHALPDGAELIWTPDQTTEAGGRA